MKEIKDFISKFLGPFYVEIPKTDWELTFD
jgi:hypothetical protein